jgi:biotin carboxyl carrier protein
MDDATERLLRRLRTSSFAVVSLRSDRLSVDLRRGRPREVEDYSAAEAASGSRPQSAMVRAPGPGRFSTHLEVGAEVGAGEQVGSVQLHRRKVAVAAAGPGHIDEILVSQGAFVEYGQPVLRIAGPLAQSEQE